MSAFDHWVLTGAVFLPIVGALLIAFIPRENEVRIKAAALATTLVTLGFGVYLLFNFDYDKSNVLQFAGQPALDRRDPLPVPRGRRRDLAAPAGPVDVHHGAVRDLQLGPLPRAA